jgi:hypothetical protein
MQLLGARMRCEDVVTGLCVACAIRHHSYKEILAHGKGEDYFSDLPLPAAWIDGRRHRLETPAQEQGMTCGECRNRVACIYLPITE